MTNHLTKEPINFKEFPTTRYQGSKRKILPWMYEIFRELKFHTVLDTCGGSGSVSYLLKKMGKSVTYNDKLHFNYIIGKAIIENKICKLTSDDCENLKQYNNKINYNPFIADTFRDIYFLDDENAWLDLIANNIINMNHYLPSILEYKKALAFYSLFQASLIKRPFNMFHRKNLGIRVNNVERSFGNKITWDKSFDEHFLRFVNEVNNIVFDSGCQCFSKNQSIFDIDPYNYQLVYIDLPYITSDGSNESSNYLQCYHFLEGLSKYNTWRDLIDYNSINLRMKNINQENDFTKENVYQKIEEILIKFKRNKIVFSYKKGGIPSIDFITKKMKQIGKSVYTKSIHYKYALNNQNGDAKNNREVIIIGL